MRPTTLGDITAAETEEIEQACKRDRAEREILPGDASTSMRLSEDSAREIQEHERRLRPPAAEGRQPKTSATADKLNRAHTLLTSTLAQHGDDYYRAGLETCLRVLADHAPGTFVAMVEMVSELFAEQPEPLPLLAERLHNLGSAKFLRQRTVSPAFAADMHQHYYDALLPAARAAMRPLREARRLAQHSLGQAYKKALIDDAIAQQATEILIREVSKSSDLFRRVDDEERRHRARKALFTSPSRPTWTNIRGAGRARGRRPGQPQPSARAGEGAPADVAAMLLVLTFGKGEIRTPESWRDKVKDGKPLYPPRNTGG